MKKSQVRGAWSTDFTKSRLPLLPTTLKSALTSLLVAKEPHIHSTRPPACHKDSPHPHISIFHFLRLPDLRRTNTCPLHISQSSRTKPTPARPRTAHTRCFSEKKRKGGLETPKNKLVAFYFHADSIPTLASYQLVDVATN